MLKIMVKKESGELEVYQLGKVERAMERAGLSEKTAREVLLEFEPKLYDGITTNEIYTILFKIINKNKPEATHKFNLKHALVGIGPEGHEFEDFAAKLLTFYGYETKTRQTLFGKCVSHEIDVVASKGNDIYAAECKFHNSGGVKCRIQTALYTHARFLDLVEGSKLGKTPKFTKPWLICNTKFSEDVVTYAKCIGMPLLGWHYPENEGLEALIEKKKCWPITAIPMPKAVAISLLKHGITIVQDLPESAQKLAALGEISLANAKSVIENAAYAR